MKSFWNLKRTCVLWEQLFGASCSALTFQLSRHHLQVQKTKGFRIKEKANSCLNSKILSGHFNVSFQFVLFKFSRIEIRLEPDSWTDDAWSSWQCKEAVRMRDMQAYLFYEAAQKRACSSDSPERRPIQMLFLRQDLWRKKASWGSRESTQGKTIILWIIAIKWILDSGMLLSMNSWLQRYNPISLNLS